MQIRPETAFLRIFVFISPIRHSFKDVRHDGTNTRLPTTAIPSGSLDEWSDSVLGPRQFRNPLRPSQLPRSPRFLWMSAQVVHIHLCARSCACVSRVNGFVLLCACTRACACVYVYGTTILRRLNQQSDFPRSRSWLGSACTGGVAR